MRVRDVVFVSMLLASCGIACGQVSPIYTVESNPAAFEEDLSTAPALAVGPARVVVAGTHQLRLFNKAGGGLLDDVQWGPSHPEPTYPFQPRMGTFAPNSMSLVYPRADYDPISGRTWMMFSEMGELAGAHYEPSGGAFCSPYLHLAVSKPENGVFNTLSDSDWWYYTGVAALNLNSSSVQNYQSDPSHAPLSGVAMLPTLGFDDRAVFVSSSDNGVCGLPEATSGTDPAIVVIPRKHDGGTKSILAGDRPAEGDLLIARLKQLPEEDGARTVLAVQEPYEQYPNMTLFISTDGKIGSGVIMEDIRLRGIYNEEPDPNQPAGDWLIRQSLKLNAAGTDVVLADMNVSADWPALRLEPPSMATSSEFPLAPSGFRPYVDSDSFVSAVLTKDNQGNPRVFATHASLDATFGGDGWVVQWYVIDPKISDFFTLTPQQDTGWNPEIVQAGRIETDGAAQPADGDCYLPVLGVTRSGQVYIEYTFSNASVYPKVLRAILNNSYSAVASTTVVKSGPSAGYGATLDLWGLYPDMQADPTGCSFWSTHTLVEDANERAVWLFNTPFNCFQTDMNLDGGTDPIDMMEYTNAYVLGDRRADTDADMIIDAADLANFVDAYDAATGP